MATIIDNLLVSLGLDTSAFSKGQKEASAGLKKTSDEATKAAKEMEARGKQAAMFYTKIRNEVLSLTAAYLGTSAIKSFVENITTSDAAVGRMAHNVGMSTEDLSAWQGAVERAGGTASGMGGSIKNLTHQFQQMSLTGQSAVIPYFRAIGVSISDSAGKMRPMNDILLDLADKFKGMDPAKAQALGAGMGLDEGTINLLMKGRVEVSRILEEQRKMNVVTKADADAAIQRQIAWKNLTDTFTSLGRTILNEVSPPLTKLLGEFGQWLVKNKEWIATGIVGAVKDFSNWVKSIDWTAVGAGIKNFVRGANDAAQAVGGRINVAKILFALWAGAKVLGMVVSIVRISTALSGIGTAATIAGAEAATAVTGVGVAAAGALPLVTQLAIVLGGLLKLGAAGAIGYAVGTVIKNAADANIKKKSEGKVESVGELQWLRTHNADGSFRWQGLFSNETPEEATKRHGDGKLQSPTPRQNAPVPGYPGASGGSASPGSEVRGIRNNNPGNLEFAGQTGAVRESGEGRFAKFATMQEGIAALVKQLQLYGQRGVDTIRGIISKYAPAGENNTEAYIQSVMKKLGVGSEEHLDLKNNATLKALVEAITNVEVGKGKVTPQQIDSGLALRANAMSNVKMVNNAPNALPSRSTTNMTNSTSTNTSSTDIKVGQVLVQTQATDATGIAKDIGKAMEQYTFASQANMGLA